MNLNPLSVTALSFACLAAACSSTSAAPDTGVGGASAVNSGGSAGLVSTSVGGSVTSGGSTGAAGTSSDGGASGALASGGTAGVDSGSSGGSGATGGSVGGGTAGAGAAGGAIGTATGGSGGAVGQAGASPSAGCPSSAVFCDDFESQTAMAQPAGKWASRTGGMATVTVDTTHAHSGTKAVHFHSASVDNNQRAYMLTQGVAGFPVVSDTLYVRFMFYIGRYISTGSSVHNRIAWVGSSALLASGGGDGDGYVFATYNGIAIERLQTDHGFQRDTTQHMDDANRANKWQCFEFEIDNKGGVPAGEKSDSTTLPHIWQDGVELKLSAGGSTTSWLSTPFEAVQFSLWCPQTDTKGTDYWIDDVVVSKQRINCPAQ